MSPYEIHHADAVEYMATIEDGSVDHVLTDPPYSAHTHANAKRSRYLKQPEDMPLGFASLDPETREAAAHEIARVARRWILVFSDVENAHLWREALLRSGAEHVRTGFWIRNKYMPQITGDRPASRVEAIVIAHRPGRKRWNGGGTGAAWFHTPEDERFHTAQKPLSLMRELVSLFTESGDLILDPFAGSGTTGVAAVKEGRRFLGCEIDANFQSIAAKRLRAAADQPRLLGALA